MKLEERLAHYPLLAALIERRSRRFGEGMSLNGGPLAYDSTYAPQSLSLQEEAALAFAGCGITGFALADLLYESGDAPEADGGNIMTHSVGRTVASGDAMHNTTLFVLNDEGTWMLKRPQDYPRDEITGLSQAAREHRLVELYEKSRMRIAEERLDVPRELPFVAPFNKWSANLPGTTYFLLVAECSALYINLLFSAFGVEFGYFVVDERNRFKPPGIVGFARSKGGHLHDDPGEGHVATIDFLETRLYEFIAIEQGGMLQNIGLMTQALGLGGLPHFAAHPFIWFQTLGLRMQEIHFSRTIGAGQRSARAYGNGIGIGQRDAHKALLPTLLPQYRRGRAGLRGLQVRARKGTFRDGDAATGWQEGARLQNGIPPYSDEVIAATIAYCEYVHERYRRFPANSGPFRIVLAHQAHHLDPNFYERFYRPEVLTEAQHRHLPDQRDEGDC